MNYEDLLAAQRELLAIAELARRALSHLPEGSTMHKAASAALEAVEAEAEGIQPFIDALAVDAERVIAAELERKTSTATMRYCRTRSRNERRDNPGEVPRLPPRG
ncbi:MAG TPA: hypothetical protein VMM12_14085 [Longimicrobiales bacterium]|nr:hypothetical protein [Longimicrobiales bacterium]